MQTLAELQSALSSFVLSPPGPPTDPNLIGAIPERGVPVAMRLGVYKNNVYARLTEALAASFPAVERLVGEAFFRFAATQFLTRHPPRSTTLIGYGDRFPDFLATFEPAQSVPYLADVARLEQLYLEAYHSADATAASLQALEPWLLGRSAEVRINLHPSARLMHSAFPVSRIWELNRREEAIDGRISIDGRAEHLLVIRPEATVEVRRLHAATYAALVSLHQGRSLDEARAEAAGIDPGLSLDKHLLSLTDGSTFCIEDSKS